MAAKLTPSVKFQAFDSNGDPLNGGLLYTYAAGTVTAKDTYTDQGAGTANANPVVLDSRGEADVWIDGAYKFVLKDSSEVTIWTVDDIGTIDEAGTLSKTSNYTVAAADVGAFIKCDASGGSFTITMPAAADQTDGFNVSIKKIDTSSNTVTINPNASETIEDQLTWVLTSPYESVTIVTDTSEWFIKNRTNWLYDDNSNEVLKTGTTASAVNEITITNAATSGLPIVAASGGDTNVGIILRGKGTGAMHLGTSTTSDVRLLGDQPIADSSGNEYIKFSKTASAVNEITVTNSATGNAVTVGSTGGDTDIGLIIQGKGTGRLDLGSATSAEIRLLGDQPITDSSGNEYLKFSKTSSAVNELTIANAATATNPNIAPTGGDTNIGIDLTPKAAAAVSIKGNSTQAGELRLYEDTDNGTNYTAFKAPASVASNVTWTLPSADGSANNALVTDGSGTLSFSSVGVFTRIASSTASSSASIAFTDLTTAYSTLLVIFTNVVPATNAVNFDMTFSTDNGSTYLSSAYFWRGYQVQTSGEGSSGSGGSTEIRLTHTTGTLLNTAGRGYSGHLYLYGSNTAAPLYATGMAVYGSAPVFFGGGITGTTAVNAIKFAMSSGNISTGTITLYGLS